MNSFVITALDGTTFDLFDPRIPCTIEEGSQHCGLQGVDTLAVKVRSALPLPLAVGDSCSLFGKRYFLNTVPPVTKAAPRKFVYELVFEGIQYSLMDVRFLLPEGSVSDSLTADLGMFLSVLTDNITRVKGNWTLGVFPSGTEYKTLVFDGENCLSVLQQICEAYGQEFEIEQDEGMNILHIRKAGQSLPFTFKFGSAGGLYSLTRQNVDSKNIVTRLYVYGGSNNLAKYRHGKLCLPGKSKNQSYIEESNAINAYGVRENIQVFGDIFPNRYGEVTAPGDDYLSFVDSTMNFDLNEKEADGITTRWLIADVTAKVHFNTGRLAGYEFEIQRDGGYDHATKTVKLIPFTDENGMEFPSRTNAAFQLSAGDKYFFKDIRLPDQYVTDAENELAEKGQAFYAQNSYPQVTYGLNIHEHFIKQFAGSGNITTLFSVGDYIHVVDPDVAVDRHIRIASFERDVLKPYKYVLTLADVVTRDVFTRAISDVLALDRIIAMNNLADPSRARRAWRASQEVLAMVFDPEGDYYSDRIKPLSIETGMLQVGAKSMQFVLRNIIFEPNYEGNPNVMHVTAGQLIHYAIEESIKTWNLAEVTFSEMVSSTAYYIYARCPKGTDAGSVLLDTVQRKVDYEAGYYTFLIGVLNSVETDDDGGRPARFVSLTYGSSTVNGRFIRTGRIESSGGGTGYIDLDAPDGIEISGKTVFRSGSSGYDNIVDKPDLTPYDEALNYVDNVLPDTLEHIQNQLDNAIESWFYHYDPTVSNYPASDWTTGALREAHLDDTFTNLDSGQSWRFTKDAGGVYSWTLMADTAASRALVLAGQAKDTADGKRRSFVSQPYPPYDAGDLWVQG
ncbi:MAG: phage tail protein, partial [Tannerella sp.]|nr:phage tail protein [Tannerella sp.]